LQWKGTNEASSITAKVNGLVAKVREVNPEERFHHCFIHCGAIVAKNLPSILKNMLDEVIKISKFINSRRLVSQIFRFRARNGALNTPLSCFT
jgi:hypothetical protein